jgi:hypothetical protein
MHTVNVSLHRYFWAKITILWIIMAGSGMTCKAQTIADYDEISVSFNIQRVGTAEMQTLIYNETAYIPVVDLFDFLKINIVSRDLDAVSGTFIHQNAAFLFDLPNNNVVYKGKNFDLKPNSLIKTASNLYLRSDYFYEIFGLNCLFNFRSLSVVISTDLELPVMREMRLEQMRNNLNKLQGVFKTDVFVGRKNPSFYFGTADYSLVTSAGNNETPTDTRASLGVGGIVAGGETNAILNYQSNIAFSNRQQYFLWRYVDNDQTLAKQFLAGNIKGQSISSIYAPIVGVQVTNAPTTYRRSFGTYTINNYTEPNWTVELYVNGVLINYIKADAAGFYTFKVPLVYGNTAVKLRFYGPFGEERSTEENINIPFNFLPKGEFEYTASAGIVEDGQNTRFGRFSSNYGFNKNITVGAGFEYLSSITSGTEIPYVNTSFRLFPNLLISGEYDYNVRSKAVLSYNLASGLQFEMYNYWYKRGQTAINNTFIEDHKAILSFPFRGRHYAAYTRLSWQDIRLENTHYSTTEWMLSTVVGNMNASANTFGLFFPNKASYLYTNYAIGIRSFRNMLITQQLQYEYSNKKVMTIKTELEKRIFINGYANLSYEKNFISDISYAEFGLRYDFSFAQTRFSVRKTNDVYRTQQSINGSLIHDGRSGITDFNNYTSIGKGAILLIPYLDVNGNMRRDNDEPDVQGLKVIVNAGRTERSAKDGSILIKDLEAYGNLNIELDPSGFERVAWRLVKKNYTVVVEPNFVKNIEVPVSVFGEVGGRVFVVDNQDEKGIAGIVITIYNDKSKNIAEITSEADGYFSYLGLLPGNYTAKINVIKLEKMGLTTKSASFEFNILSSTEGTLIDNIKFKFIPVN